MFYKGGTVLQIKPVFHVDDEGHLVNMQKARGRKASLNILLQKYEELALDKAGVVFISHADSLKDAEYIKEQLVQKHRAKVEVITDIDPVLGAHAGPGTLAVFFLGTER